MSNNPAGAAPSARERQREETRRKVYEAALQVFRRDGVHASRIDDIARLAGVSHGTFYFHFPTKDDVLIDLFRVTGGRLAAELERLPPEASLVEVLEAICNTMASDWHGDPQLFPDVGMVALRQFTTGQPSPQMDAIRGGLADRFRIVTARGELTMLLPPEVLSDFFLINLFAAALAWSGNPTMIELDAMLKNVALFFLRGASSQV